MNYTRQFFTRRDFHPAADDDLIRHWLVSRIFPAKYDRNRLRKPNYNRDDFARHFRNKFGTSARYKNRRERRKRCPRQAFSCMLKGIPNLGLVLKDAKRSNLLKKKYYAYMVILYQMN